MMMMTMTLIMMMLVRRLIKAVDEIYFHQKGIHYEM